MSTRTNCIFSTRKSQISVHFKAIFFNWCRRVFTNDRTVRGTFKCAIFRWLGRSIRRRVYGNIKQETGRKSRRERRSLRGWDVGFEIYKILQRWALAASWKKSWCYRVGLWRIKSRWTEWLCDVYTVELMVSTEWLLDVDTGELMVWAEWLFNGDTGELMVWGEWLFDVDTGELMVWAEWLFDGDTGELMVRVEWLFDGYWWIDGLSLVGHGYWRINVLSWLTDWRR